MWLWSLLAVFSVLHVPTDAAPSFRSPSSQPSPAPLCEGAIACTLEQIQIGPLHFCIDIPIANSTEVYGLCVQDFVCDNIDFSGLESVYVSPHTLQIAVDNLGIDCLGEWNVTETNTASNDTSLLYEGEFSLGMDHLTVATAMDFTNYSSLYALPQALLFNNCSVPSANFEVHFLGGAIGKTLDKTLAPKLEAGLEDHVDELLCDVLGEALSTGLSSIILESNVRREATIEAGRAYYPPPIINGTYDWRTSQLASLHSLLDSLSLHSAGGTGGDMANCLLNSSALDVLRPPPSGNDDSELLINKLLDLLTNDTGEIYVPLNTVIPLGNTSSTLQIDYLVLSGLDTFTNLSLLVPSSSSGAVLSSSIGMEELKLQVFMQLNASSSAEDESSSYVEAMVVTLDLSHMLLALDMVVALSEDSLGSIYVDQYLNDSSCVLLALQELSVSSLTLAVIIEEVSLTQISGDATSLEEDVVQLLDNLLEWLLASWPVTDLLTGLGQTAIKDRINANLEERRNSLQQQAASSCPEHVEASGVEYMDWNTSAKISKLNAVLNTAMGVDGLNSLMTCVTGGTGELTVFKNNSNASLTLSGLNSFYQFALLYPLPSEPYDLGSSIAVGQCDGNTECQPFGLTLQGQVGQKEIFLDVEMQNVELFLDLLFMIDKTAVLNLNLLQMQTQGCVMTATESLLIQASSLHLTDAELYLDDGESEPINITHAVETILTHFEEVGGLVSKLNDMLAQVTATAADRCAGTFVPSQDDEASATKSDGSPRDWTWQIALLMIGCFLSLVFLAYLYQHFGVMTEAEEAFRDSLDILQKDRSSSLQDKLMISSEHPDTVHLNCETDEEKLSNPTLMCANRILACFGYGHVHYDALFASPEIPLVVRALFPVAVVGCISVTMIANIAVGTSVMVELNIGNIKIEPDSVFDFALGNTVSDMWSAGVYPLALLVAFFSGAWPYIKLLAMLTMWFAPSAAVTLWRRGWVLKWLDVLGKWSLIDAYVMVMMMVAFHVEMNIAPSLSVIITVVPRIGFNLFLVSVLTSLGLGHIAMGCHRMASEDKIRGSNARKEALKEHIFTWKCFSESSCFAHEETSPAIITPASKSVIHSRFQFTSFGKGLVAAAIILSIFIVLAGVFMLTFVFHFKGLVGFILGSEDDPKYSLITTGTAVSTATGDPNSFVVRWIQACFFGFGVVMPLFFLFLMLIMWVIPLRLTTYRKYVVFAEVANAWNAIDVFVVSVVAALFEIQQFAEFIIGDSCDTINELLEEKNPNPDGDNKCFDVTAGLLPNFWMLGLAALLMMTFGLSLLRIAQSNLTDRRLLDRGQHGLGVGAEGDMMHRLNLPPSEDMGKLSLYERNEQSILTPDSSTQSASGVPSDLALKDEEEGRVQGWVDRCSAYSTAALVYLRIVKQV